eukprot:281334-Alexandrium_andersonii.AAC.1
MCIRDSPLPLRRRSLATTGLAAGWRLLQAALAFCRAATALRVRRVHVGRCCRPRPLGCVATWLSPPPLGV